jgi:hypothetical protein
MRRGAPHPPAAAAAAAEQQTAAAHLQFMMLRVRFGGQFPEILPRYATSIF